MLFKLQNERWTFLPLRRNKDRFHGKLENQLIEHLLRILNFNHFLHFQNHEIIYIRTNGVPSTKKHQTNEKGA